MSGPVLFSLLLTCTLPWTQGAGSSNIEGKQVMREIFPDRLCTNLVFGSGYNSITLSRTGTATIQHNSSTVHVPGNAFISHSFKIKHFSGREDLRAEFDSDSEIAKSEGFMGSSKSAFVKILTAADVTVLDSVLVVDIDIVTDSTSIRGHVEMSPEGKNLLDVGQYTKFIEKFGTHYLRKKVYGGKLILMIRISSKTKAEKEEMDKKLKMTAGSIGNDPEFRSKMYEIELLGKLHLSLYTLGGVPYTGDISLDSAIEYVLKFSGNVLVKDEVRELEFLGLWRTLGVPRDFGQHVFSYQHETDKIMAIFSGLQEVTTTVEDIALLRFYEMSWLSDDGWSEIVDVRTKLAKHRQDITRQFGEGDIHGFWGISEEYKDTVPELMTEIQNILQDERRYRSSDNTYLRSASLPALYVSTANWEYYARASSTSPIPIFLEDSSSHREISFSFSHSTFIKSRNYPGYVLCMGRNYYGVYWKALSAAYTPYCTWYLQHSTEPRKETLEYGDRFVIYNVHWSSFTFGLDTSGRWIVALYENSVTTGHPGAIWELEKISWRRLAREY